MKPFFFLKSQFVKGKDKNNFKKENQKKYSDNGALHLGIDTQVPKIKSQSNFFSFFNFLFSFSDQNEQFLKNLSCDPEI